MKNFYISLPENTPSHTISLLFRHALSELEKDVADKPFDISHFNLVSPYTNDGVTSVYVAYDILTRQQLSDRAERHDYADETRITPEPPTDEAHEWQNRDSTYGTLEFRLASGSDQDDARRLIVDFIAKLEQLGNIKPLDCVYHSFCDDDGLDHPFFRLYYLK